MNKGKEISFWKRLLGLTQSPVAMYRIIGMVAGSGIIGLWWAFPEDVHDPFWMRLVVGGLCILIPLASYFLPIIRKKAEFASYFLLYLVAFWVFYLNWTNDLKVEYVFGFYLNVFVSSLVFRRLSALFLFAALNIIAGIIVVLWTPDPLFPPGLFILFLIFLSGLCSVILGVQIRVRESLRKSVQAMGSLYEGSPDAILIINPRTWEIESFNSRATTFLKEWDGEPNPDLAAIQVLPDIFSPELLPEISASMAAEQGYQNEILLHAGEETEYWVDIAIRKVSWADKDRWLLRIVDVSEHRKIEQSLQLSDDILRNVPSLVLVTNPEGAVLYASPSIQRMLGYQPAEVMGNKWWELTRATPEEGEQERQRIQDFAKSGMSGGLDYTERPILKKSGEARFFSWTLSMTREGNVIGVGRDVTRERRERFVKEVIYSISAAAAEVPSLMAFYRTIHRELIRAVGGYNIYIALKEDGGSTISFPYYADQQYSDDYTPVTRVRNAGEGLTEFVMSEGQGRIYSEDDLIQLEVKGKIAVVGKGQLPKVWMGVPLYSQERVIGLVAVQDYENPEAFGEEDLDLLNFISGQIASVITKLQAEEAERRSQEKYRAITEAAFEGIGTLREGILTECNEVFAAIYGQQPDAIRGLPLSSLIHGDQKEMAMNQIFIGDGHRVEFTILPEGEMDQRTLEGIGLEQKDNKGEYILLAIRDITAIKESEEKAASARLDARFRSYVQNSSEIIAITDGKGVFNYVSPAVERILGLKPETLTGEFIGERAHPEDLKKLEAALEQALGEEKGHTEVEFRTQNADGDTRVLQSVITNLLDDPLLNGVLISSRDITQKKEAEQQLNNTLSTIKATFESTKDGVLVVNNQGDCLNYNQQFLDVFDMPESIIYNTPERMEFAFSRAVDQPFFMERMRVLMEGEKDEDSFYLDLVNGKTVNVYIRPLFVGEERIGRMWFFHDITEIKRAQDELANYLALLETTFDLSTDGVLVVGEDRSILNYNRLFLDLWGIDEMDFVKGTVEGRFEMGKEQVINQDQFEQTIQKTLTDSRAETFDVLELKNGRIIERFSKPLEISGESRGRVWFYRDVTERILSNRIIEENENKYRSLFSQANDAIFLMEDEKFIECNEKTFEMFRCTAEEILEQTPWRFSPELQPDGTSSREKAAEYIQAALEGNPQFFPWKHIRLDGTPFDAEVSLNRIAIGEKWFIQAMVRDISEQVLAGQALRLSERRNKAILDAIPDLIFRASAEGVILDLKAGQENVLGVHPGKVLGNNIRELFTEEIAGLLVEKMESALASGEVQELEFAYEDDERNHADYEVRVTMSGSEEIIVIVRNVTERKQAENELIQRNFELDSFVYRASHDLKAPLNSLMGLIHLAKSEETMERMPLYFSMMDKSVSKLDSFIRDLTDFSRNARLDTQFKEIDFEEMIRDSMDNLKFMEHADRVSMSLDIRIAVPFYSDPLRIGIILNNLISNGVKYIDLNKDSCEVKVTVTADEEHAVIRIQDNGIGIGSSHLNKIFDLFYRATSESFGSGLGLYIVKNSVEKLNGKVEVDSVEGKGTTFIITLPNTGPPEPEQ